MIATSYSLTFPSPGITDPHNRFAPGENLTAAANNCKCKCCNYKMHVIADAESGRPATTIWDPPGADRLLPSLTASEADGRKRGLARYICVGHEEKE